VLQRLHPEVAGRSCDDCRKYIYTAAGEIDTYQDLDESGAVVKRPKERLPGIRTPCDTPTGCPKGHYTAPFELSSRAASALDYYRRCRAVGRFEDDEWLTTYATAIDGAERLCDRIEARQNAIAAFASGTARSVSGG
jgi:hypothetical protein